MMRAEMTEAPPNGREQSHISSVRLVWLDLRHQSIVGDGILSAVSRLEPKQSNISSTLVLEIYCCLALLAG